MMPKDTPTAMPEPTATAMPPPTPTPEAMPEPTAMPGPAVSRLVVAAPFELEGNDPYAVRPAEIAVQGLPFEGLSEEDPDYTFQPQLAESWETSDLRTWTFKLRQGVPFHFDNGEFTSADVRFTMEQQTREDSLVTEKDKIAGWLETLQTPDDYTVIITSETIDPVMCCDQGIDRATWGMMLSKAYFDATGPQGLQDRMVGTGPYQFVERKPGESVIFERVAYEHYRVTPEFPEVEVRNIGEASTRLALLVNGGIHLTLLPSDLNAAAIAGGMEVVDAVSPSVLVAGMFGGLFLESDEAYDPNNPFTNVKVREALNRAIDRDTIQDSILGGRGIDMAVALWGDERTGVTETLQARFNDAYGYDPDRARALLAEAGYPNGFDTTVFLVPRVQLPGVEDVGETIGNAWQDIGVNVTFQEAEWATYIGKIVQKQNVNEFTILAADRDQPLALYRLIYYSGGCCHIFDSEFLDEKFEALGGTDNFAAREALFLEAYTHLFEQYSTVPLWWIQAQFVMNPEVIAEYRTSGQRPPRHLEYIKAAT
jgi:ABC-type transport system substrate-binding protein